MKMLIRVGTFFEQAISALAVLSGILVVFIMITITLDVVSRSIINRPIVWAIEVSEICLIGITFLGAAWVLRREAHVKMDILLVRFSPTAQVLLNTITSMIGIIICFVLAWYGAKVTLDQYQRGIVSVSMLASPIYPNYAIISIGSFLISIQFIRRTYGYLKSFGNRYSEQEAHKESLSLTGG